MDDLDVGIMLILIIIGILLIVFAFPIIGKAVWGAL